MPGINAVPHSENLRYFDVTIDGPGSSPYEGSFSFADPLGWGRFTVANHTRSTAVGGNFKLELFLPDDYPMVPPKIRFLTKIFHPNVDKLGRICLDVLKSTYPRHREEDLVYRTDELQRQLVSCPSNPHNPPLHPSSSRRAEPRRPPCCRSRQGLERRRESRHRNRPRVDTEIREARGQIEPTILRSRCRAKEYGSVYLRMTSSL